VKRFLLITMLLILITLCQAIDYEELLSSGNAMNYSVHVVGAVKNPGLYLLPPNTRISTAIKLANTIIDTLNLPNNVIINPSSRQIELRRNNEVQILDILKFQTQGSIEENPFIMDGDVILVPPAKDYVFISGAVKMEQNNEKIKLELIQGEKISDILDLVYGLGNGIDSENCYIERFLGDSSEFETIYFSAKDIINDPNSIDNIELQNGDRIYIRQQPNYQEKSYVTIEGEVKYPGEYAIEVGKTTLSEILKKCGGPTELADLSNSYLYRIGNLDVMYPEFDQLRRFSTLDLSTAEYRYVRQMYAEKRNLIKQNFTELYNSENPENDVILNDQDRIFVTMKKTVVSVNGKVNKPGLYPFVEGKNYKYYIQQAGGTIKTASKMKIRIIKAGSGEWVDADKDTKIYAGDTIYVPRHERFSYYWPYIKETIAFVSGLATSIVVIEGLVK